MSTLFSSFHLNLVLLNAVSQMNIQVFRIRALNNDIVKNSDTNLQDLFQDPQK